MLRCQIDEILMSGDVAASGRQQRGVGDGDSALATLGDVSHKDVMKQVRDLFISVRD